MYKSNSGLGIYSNRFCIKLSILLSKRKEHLMRYCSYTKRYKQLKPNENEKFIDLLHFDFSSTRNFILAE